VLQTLIDLTVEFKLLTKNNGKLCEFNLLQDHEIPCILQDHKGIDCMFIMRLKDKVATKLS
jgi:hypothetical protein